MRGYLSFLLVLCIMAALFSFLSHYPGIYSASDSRIIEVERANSISMNVKESIILSTSYWMRSSASLYDTIPEPEKNPVEREKAIKAGILAGWTALSVHEFSEDFEVEFWCGYIDSNTKKKLSAEMIKNSAIKTPEGSLPLPLCEPFIQLSQKAPFGEGLQDSVSLQGPAVQSTPFFFGAVGASIYSKKYNTADVVYIPLDTVIE